MEQKLKISIIDFLPYNGKFKAGVDKNGEDLFYGDMVEYNGDKNWFVSYRYGTPMLKQVGMMAMITSEKFKEGIFENAEKVKDTIGAGDDYLIIGMDSETFIQKLINETAITN